MFLVPSGNMGKISLPIWHFLKLLLFFPGLISALKMKFLAVFPKSLQGKAVFFSEGILSFLSFWCCSFDDFFSLYWSGIKCKEHILADESCKFELLLPITSNQSFLSFGSFGTLFIYTKYIFFLRTLSFPRNFN